MMDSVRQMAYKKSMTKTAQQTLDKPVDARINIRTKADFRRTLAHAAELSGLDLTSFIVSAAMRQAKEVIKAHEGMRIASQEDRAAFRAALETPGRHIPALAELLKTPPVLNAAKR
jgi:uncharacterized protein (DUF1778 family)